MASKPYRFVDTSIGKLAVFKFTWGCYKQISKDLQKEKDSYQLLKKLIPYICCSESLLQQFKPCSENVVLKKEDIQNLTIEDLEKIAKAILEQSEINNKQDNSLSYVVYLHQSLKSISKQILEIIQGAIKSFKNIIYKTHVLTISKVIEEQQKIYHSFIKDIINRQNEEWERLKNLVFEEPIKKYIQQINRLPLTFSIYHDTLIIGDKVYNKTEFADEIDKISRALSVSGSLDEIVEKIEKTFLLIIIVLILKIAGIDLPGININVNIRNAFNVRVNNVFNQINNHNTINEVDINKNVTSSHYRFVVANILHVRNTPSRKGDIIDELSCGKIVKILAKKRRWCLIQYEDEDTGEIKEGWVFLRYLKRFKK